MTKPAGDGVTARWLLGIATSVILLGGAGWLHFVQSQVDAVQAEQKKAAEQQADVRTDVAVIKEQIKGLVESQKRQEESQKDMTRKLDELLRRVR